MVIAKYGQRSRSLELAINDSTSFESWVKPYWSAMRLLAERLAGPSGRDDVLQEALLSAWRGWSHFDPAKGSPQAWLLTITANHAYKAFRSRKPPVPIAEPFHDGCAASKIDMEVAIRSLPPRQRMAIELFYYVDLPVAEIAAVMQVAEGTVKASLHAGRERLRSTLGEDYQ